MGRSNRKAKHDRRRAHQREQALKKKEALAESEAAAKRAKKGKKGVIDQMERRGYIPDGNGGWRRLIRVEAD